jgi:hypothetical protein
MQFEEKAEVVRRRPALYKAGRVKGTQELVVGPSYLMVYRVLVDAVEALRVLNTGTPRNSGLQSGPAQPMSETTGR